MGAVQEAEMVSLALRVQGDHELEGAKQDPIVPELEHVSAASQAHAQANPIRRMQDERGRTPAAPREEQLTRLEYFFFGDDAFAGHRSSGSTP
jgi:hypothetical protein